MMMILCAARLSQPLQPQTQSWNHAGAKPSLFRTIKHPPKGVFFSLIKGLRSDVLIPPSDCLAVLGDHTCPNIPRYTICHRAEERAGSNGRGALKEGDVRIGRRVDVVEHGEGVMGRVWRCEGPRQKIVAARGRWVFRLGVGVDGVARTSR